MELTPDQALLHASEELFMVVAQGTIPRGDQPADLDRAGIYAACLYGALRIQLTLAGELETPAGKSVMAAIEAVVGDPHDQALWDDFHQKVASLAKPDPAAATG